MAVGSAVKLTNDKGGQRTDRIYFSGTVGGALNGSTEHVFVVPDGAWNVTDVTLAAGTNTTHDTTVSITVTVEDDDGGTSYLTTAPVLIDTAGAGPVSTASSGTGITQAVVDAANDDAVGGDLVFCTLTEAGTGGADPDDVGFVVELTRQQDFDPAA